MARAPPPAARVAPTPRVRMVAAPTTTAATNRRKGAVVSRPAGVGLSGLHAQVPPLAGSAGAVLARGLARTDPLSHRVAGIAAVPAAGHRGRRGVLAAARDLRA